MRHAEAARESPKRMPRLHRVSLSAAGIVTMMLLIAALSSANVRGYEVTIHVGVKQWGLKYGVSGANVITDDDVLPPPSERGVGSIFGLVGPDWSWIEVGFINGGTGGHAPYCYSPCFFVEENTNHVNEYYFKILNKEARVGSWHTYKIYSVPRNEEEATWYVVLDGSVVWYERYMPPTGTPKAFSESKDTRNHINHHHYKCLAYMDSSQIWHPFDYIGEIYDETCPYTLNLISKTEFEVYGGG